MANSNGTRLPFGIRVERKVDLASIIALVFTAGLYVVEIREGMVGAETRLLNPRIITLFEFQCGGAEPNVEVVLPVALVNVGASGYDAIVSDIRVSLAANGDALGQQGGALWFEAFAVAEMGKEEQAEAVREPLDCSADQMVLKALTVRRDGNSPPGAVPVNVSARSSWSRPVWFRPRLVKGLDGELAAQQGNLVSRAMLLKFLHNNVVFLNIRVDVFEDQSVERSCSFALGQRERKYFIKQGWVSPEVRCEDTVPRRVGKHGGRWWLNRGGLRLN